ncbi:MAG: tetratricopeptide repeat protein, partial [Cytophagaceae bacterium]
MKKLRFFLPLIVVLVLFVLTAQAQNVNEYEAKYKRGKELYEAGKYTLAMEVLKPLTSAAEGNAYAEHAHYFYALSAFKGQQAKEARQILLQLTTRYPDWQKINEAYYLLSNISFESKNPRQALSYAEKAMRN